MTKYFRIFIVLLFIASAATSFGQSKTTELLEEKHGASLALFFYNNTLRMLNQAEDPEFDALIKDIEKMKFLMLDKKGRSIDYKKIVGDYKAEAFEEVMTSRHEGKNFDVFVKEKNNKTTGMLVLVNDEESLFVLDILGSIALNQVTKLYSTLDKNTDVSDKIRKFTDRNKSGNEDDDN